MGVGICLVDNPGCIQWSPFVENLLLAATANRPGHTPISGILYFLNFLPDNNVEIDTQVQLNVGTRLAVWSHRDESTLVASCDDSTLRFFDRTNIDCMFREWEDDDLARALDWDPLSLEWILSGGATGMRLFHLEQTGAAPVARLPVEVTDAAWHSQRPRCIDVCDPDGQVWLWDVRRTGPSHRLPVSVPPMRLSRNPYIDHLLAIADVQGGLHILDERAPDPLVAHAVAHRGAVVRLRWSAHVPDLLASASADRTLRLWRVGSGGPEPSATGGASTALSISVPPLKPQRAEDELTWLDWSVHRVGQLAYSCNDQLVKVYDVQED